MFQADTTLSEMYAFSPEVNLGFPTKQQGYDVRKLPPDWYRIALIMRKPDDGDRSNDTAYSEFSIVRHILDHDITSNSVLSPQNNSSQPPDRPIHLAFRFQNIGLNVESNFNMIALIIIFITD